MGIQKKLYKNALVKGTLILTVAGLLTRILGFGYRIYLSRFLGTHYLGIYQLIFPVYAICFTIYGAGIQTAVSQKTAACDSKNQTQALSVLKMGIGLSLFLSLTLSTAVFTFSDFIATKLVLEPLCSPYIKTLALLFPFCGISCCICGYFYGKNEAKTPASAQVIEQLSRICFVVLFSFLFSFNKKEACHLAVAGIVVGEILSCIYNIIKLFFSLTPKKHHKKKTLSISDVRSLYFLVFTLTGTKLITSVLHSVETIFIPGALCQYGLTSKEALSVFGILSGISIPFILFPSTLTNSFAVMLLPAVAKEHAKNNDSKIRNYVSVTSRYTLLSGYLFTFLFFFFGEDIGTLLFQNRMAGQFIVSLSFLCPFLYLSGTLSGTLNGLGKTQLTFFATCISLLIKICFLIFLVPRLGITAYLMGTLISQIVMTLLEIYYLRDYFSFDFVWYFWLPVSFLFAFGYMLKKGCLALSAVLGNSFSLLLLLAAGSLFLLCYTLFLRYIFQIMRNGASSKS